MTNLFLIEDAGCSHCSMKHLCQHFPEQIQLYCHTGSHDVLDFIRRIGSYSFLPMPDVFLVSYHLSGMHYSAITASIRSMPELADIPIILSSNTLPDPALQAQESYHQALQQFGSIDAFYQSPLNIGHIRHILKGSVQHYAGNLL